MSGAFLADVAIIGAGIQGCAAARELARRGASVQVLERDYAGRHASGVNAGGLRTLGRHPAELPLALESKKLWQRIEDLVDDDCGCNPIGQLRVALGAADLEAMRERSTLVRGLGSAHTETMLSEKEVRAILPELAIGVAGGCFVEGDGYALPFHATQAFRRKAAALGARFLEGAPVRSAARRGASWELQLADGQCVRAAMVLNCAGAWAGDAARWFGDELPINANGSMQIVTGRITPLLPCVVSFAGASISMKQFTNGTVLIGGGWRSPVDLARGRSELTLPGLCAAAKGAVRLFPRLAQAPVVRCWSGIEGFSPDGLPMIGFGRARGVVHAAGFSGHGFQPGPAVGQALADLALEGHTSMPIQALSPLRFATGDASIAGPAGGERKTRACT